MGMNKALALAQAEVENATKNAQNPHLKNKYANLEGVLEVAKPVLAKYGLAVVTVPGPMDEQGMQAFESTLSWEDDTGREDEKSFSFTMPLQKKDPQGVGSAITYARRYALACWMNITQEDDDGNAASKPRAPKAPAADAKATPDPSNVLGMWDTAIANAKTTAELKTLRTKMDRLPEDVKLRLSPAWMAAMVAAEKRERE